MFIMVLLIQVSHDNVGCNMLQYHCHRSLLVTKNPVTEEKSVEKNKDSAPRCGGKRKVPGRWNLMQRRE